MHVPGRDGRTWQPSEFYSQIGHLASRDGYQLVLFDSLHDIFAGNENSRPEVRGFVRMLHRMALDIDGSVMFTAHPSRAGRSDGSGESGSTGWNNSVRSRLYLTQSQSDSDDPDGQDSNRRVLSRKKANYASRGDELHLLWREGAIVPEYEPGGIVADIERRSTEDLFLDLLRLRRRQNREVSHKAKAGNYAPREFAKMPEAQGRKRRDFARAMEVLFSTKKIRVEEYGKPSRPVSKIVEVTVGDG